MQYNNKQFLDMDLEMEMRWFIVSYDSANKQKHHKSHRI